MLRLITENGQTLAPTLYNERPFQESLLKCTRYLKNVLHLEVELAKLDISSSNYTLLKASAQAKEILKMEGFYLFPILDSKNEIWAVIKVRSSDQKEMTRAQVNKVQGTLDRILDFKKTHDTETEDFEDHLVFSRLITHSGKSESYHQVLDYFYQDHFTSFINLSEWIKQGQSFNLSYLRDFNNVLFYVDEVCDLTVQQRKVLTLYSMLPKKIRKSSVVLCTQKSSKELSESLKKEKIFLRTFLDSRVSAKSLRSLTLS